MTMFETIIMVILQMTFIFIELYRNDPRALLHKPTDESPFFIGLFDEGEGDDFDDLDKSKP